MSAVNKEDFKAVFSSEQGKRVLSYICRECGVLRPSFVPGEALENTAFNEGMRNVSLKFETIQVLLNLMM